MLFEGIIFKCAFQLKQERSVSSIYYLLKGKRSIQTVQDAHLYGLGAFYGIYKSLSKPEFNSEIERLVKEGFLMERTDEENRSFISLTEKAVNFLRENQENLPFHYFNGIYYHEIGELFYQRLLLLLQTFTNTVRKNYSFIPVIEHLDAERWVKQFYRIKKGEESAYLTLIGKELESILDKLPDEKASLFVDRLSGFKHYGKSIAQLQDIYGKSEADIRLLLAGMTHFLIENIKKDRSTYCELNALIPSEDFSKRLQHSTKQTYTLFKQNYSPEQIARLRRLKMNTIYDHLAEISLYDPDFPFSLFITNDEKKEILAAIENANTFKLKEIKNNVRPEISFFQIRLMLVWHQKIKAEQETKEIQSF